MRNSVLFAIVLVLLGLLVAGCPKQGIVSDTETDTAPQQTEGQEVVPDTTDDVTVTQEDVTSTDIARTEPVEPAMTTPAITDIYFDFDSSTIKEEYKSQLMTLSNTLLTNKTSVLVEGHCDDRGTNEYNLALGDRRANSVKSFLKASGVPASQIETISFGEEKPVCSQENEGCWSKNRRAHFVMEGSK